MVLDYFCDFVKMYIEVSGLENIEDWELYDYHERVVEQFKNEYTYAFTYALSKVGNITVKFDYDFMTKKMTLISMENYLYIHQSLVSTDPKIKIWF